jgi:hypothetical protein
VAAIKDQGAAYAHGRAGIRSLFLVVQVALCLVLVIGAGLFIRSLQTALRIDPGFETERLALASVNLGLERYGEAEAEGFYQESVRRITTLPGVEAASWATSPPLVAGAAYMLGISVEGYEPRAGEELEAEFNYVSDDYFATVSVPLVRGRGFTEDDRQGAASVFVINETMRKRFFGDADPIGRTVGVGIILGIGASALSSRALDSFLYGVSTTDPLTFVIAALILTAVALLASYIPACRATKVDPMVALRYEYAATIMLKTRTRLTLMNNSQFQAV